MSITYQAKKSLRHRLLEPLFSRFFHYLTQSIIVAKIKQHGRIFATSYDFLAIMLAWGLATMVTLHLDSGFTVNAFIQKTFLINSLCMILIQFSLLKLIGLSRGFWRFASIQDLQKIVSIALLGGIIVDLLLSTRLFSIASSIHFSHPNIPRHTLALLYTVFLIILLSTARLCVRLAKDYKNRFQDCKRVIVIGAGNAGEGLVRDLLRDDSERYKPIAFIDNNPSKLGREIHGVPVIGTIDALPLLVIKHHIDLLLIAMPSATSASMRTVVDLCEKTSVPYYTLPGIKDLTSGHVNINALRNILLEDLLGRYPVTYQWESIKNYLNSKTIFITGGGGSIGSELCLQIASLKCAHSLIVLDSNEFNLYSIDIELKKKYPDCKFHPVLLNITDRAGMQHLFEKYRPEIVFHAAAYKHVPLLESQPRVAIFNNIIGTKILAEEASNANVETFVLISSDKAVNPTNVMGATKRAAEQLCQNFGNHSKTKFITVRFGNVLDSVGSVIPLFRKQIEAGGPVTVTHPEITRFFMTIPEASQLILQAAFLGKGGEIFVLDMGDPIKIGYLAEQMIKLSGKIVGQDIKIIYTGLRPGEKLYEECFYQNEILQPTAHEKILRAQLPPCNIGHIQTVCNQIIERYQHASTTKDDWLHLLRQIVPEYGVLNMGPISSSNYSMTAQHDTAIAN